MVRRKFIKVHADRAGFLVAAVVVALLGIGAVSATASETESDAEPAASENGGSEPGEVEVEEEASLEQRVAGLVEALGSRRYQAREQASRAIRNLVRDPEHAEAVMRQLGPAYAETRDPEVRMRIRAVAEDYFLSEVLPDRLRVPAFLGVSTQTAVTRVPEGPDGEQPAAEVAMRIDRVLPGTAAEKHGLRAGDLIVGMDGQRFGPEYRFEDFTGYIRDRGAGREVVFSVIRPPEMDRVRAMAITLGVMPDEMLNPPERETLAERTDALRLRWWDEAFTQGRLHLPEPEDAGVGEETESAEAEEVGTDGSAAGSGEASD